MQRRDFLKGACRICLLGAAGATVMDMASCSPAVGNSIFRPDIVDNAVTIPLALFDQKNFGVISPNKYPYEVAIEKKEDGNFIALLLKCTHYDNQLTPTGNGFTCAAHGSKFTLDGTVVKGPAEAPLKQLKTTKTNTDLIVNLLRVKK